MQHMHLKEIHQQHFELKIIIFKQHFTKEVFNTIVRDREPENKIQIYSKKKSNYKTKVIRYYIILNFSSFNDNCWLIRSETTVQITVRHLQLKYFFGDFLSADF